MRNVAFSINGNSSIILVYMGCSYWILGLLAITVGSHRVRLQCSIFLPGFVRHRIFTLILPLSFAKIFAGNIILRIRIYLNAKNVRMISAINAIPSLTQCA